MKIRKISAIAGKFARSARRSCASGNFHMVKVLAFLAVLSAALNAPPSLAAEGAAGKVAAVAHESCETRCKHKCPWYEVTQCVDDCVSGHAPECHGAPVAGFTGFHWPGCHDSWPDCIPPDEIRGEMTSCFTRCQRCDADSCPGHGGKSCGTWQCYSNCSMGKHPVCCYGCVGDEAAEGCADE